LDNHSDSQDHSDLVHDLNHQINFFLIERKTKTETETESEKGKQNSSRSPFDYFRSYFFLMFKSQLVRFRILELLLFCCEIQKIPTAFSTSSIPLTITHTVTVVDTLGGGKW
jgi:hypothetical protein